MNALGGILAINSDILSQMDYFLRGYKNNTICWQKVKVMEQVGRNVVSHIINFVNVKGT